jgi:ATP-dependent DNA helicase RecG
MVAYKVWRQKGLIEGRKPNYIVAANIARHTEQQAEYMLLKGLNEEYYENAVLDLLKQFGQASRSDFDKFLAKKLPDVLSDEQKFHKVKNLLQKMKKKNLIYFEDKVWKLVNN